MINFFETIGTIAFALSGIRLAANKQFDLFGLFIVGLVTSIGGGTMRDILLGVTPFWFNDTSSFLIVLLSLIGFALFRNIINKIAGTIFLFDTIGLALFTLIGFDKAIGMGCSWLISTMIGTLTGAGGGVIRDICINEEPLIFRKEIYALACVAGCVLYGVAQQLGASTIICQILCVATVMLVRILSVKFSWQLPVLKV